MASNVVENALFAADKDAKSAGHSVRVSRASCVACLAFTSMDGVGAIAGPSLTRPAMGRSSRLLSPAC
jgi:hypothetical protein